MDQSNLGFNNSIWISATNDLTVRRITDTYAPTGAQVLVKVHFSGINPADIKHGLHLGLNNYPSGYEYSGEVIALGPDAKFSVGDFVFGHNLAGKNKPIYHGAHQDMLIGEHFVSLVPPNVPLEVAACISIMVQTAADALFNQLEMSGGSVLGEKPVAVPILIWGGASTVGIAAIQLARAAGMSPIFTTASRHNHEVLRGLGATHCFDYRDADVVNQLHAALKESGSDELHAVFDTIASRGPRSSIVLCEDCAVSDNVKLAATLPQPARPKWKMVLATRNVNFPFPTADGGMKMTKANTIWQDKIDRSLQWCLKHYGEENGFIIPKIKTVNGAEEGMVAMRFVMEGKSSLEKTIIKHPL